MPKLPPGKTKAPEGWELIEPTLEEFAQKMRDGEYYVNLVINVAENDPHEGKRKAESVWPIFRIHHQRSRYIFELYYKLVCAVVPKSGRKKQITKELYDFCLKNKYADGNLIAKWKKVCHFERDDRFKSG